MIDSVLKGTGNSRFLKSAVPAGTSWADALAMLQAGTFPIDFNGINTEGFQQVGTPLNKANLLKDVTAAQIGLPPSTTPDGMFQALGNTGELHVWRKTVVTGTAKVELEPAVSGYIVSNNGSNYNQTIKYSSTIDEKGNLSGTITTLTVAYNTSNSDLFVLKGKYFEAGTTEISSNLKSPGGVWYIPNDASIQYITGQPNTTGYPYYYTHVATKMQKVVYVPAGTTTTYPVSTNPNAYQEGDDAKEAGYVVGDIVTGKFGMGMRFASSDYIYSVASEISVADDGAISLKNPSEFRIGGNDGTPGVASNVTTAIAGKYIQMTQQGPRKDQMAGPFLTAPSAVLYIPSGVVATREEIGSGNTYTWYFIDRYQPVTGYAAIPAGTTIEYLGKLGDKARVQVVSYVGTGTYGKDNPCSISVDFSMKAILFIAKTYAHSSGYRLAPYFASINYDDDIRSVPVDRVPTVYTNHFGLGDVSHAALYGRRSEDCKSYYWYNESDPAYQGNTANSIYYFLVIG